MLTYVCKHGVEAGVIIEGEFEREAAIIRARMMDCEKCKNEAMAELVGAIASITNAAGTDK